MQQQQQQLQQQQLQAQQQNYNNNIDKTCSFPGCSAEGKYLCVCQVTRYCGPNHQRWALASQISLDSLLITHLLSLYCISLGASPTCMNCEYFLHYFFSWVLSSNFYQLSLGLRIFISRYIFLNFVFTETIGISIKPNAGLSSDEDRESSFLSSPSLYSLDPSLRLSHHKYRRWDLNHTGNSHFVFTDSTSSLHVQNLNEEVAANKTCVNDFMKLSSLLQLFR